MIITDQDPALSKAICTILPETYHRFCLWHIIRKMLDKIGRSITNRESFRKVYNCIKFFETGEDFESGWKIAIEENNLEDNGWLKFYV